jgi:hypothetical protein
MKHYIKIKDNGGHEINEAQVKEIREYYHYIYDHTTHSFFLKIDSI